MEGLNSAFAAVYWLLLLLAVACLLLMLALAFFGVARFAVESWTLARRARVNQSMMLESVFGFASLFKFRADLKTHDPYLLNVQAGLLSGCFNVLAATVVALGLHGGIAMSLYIYAVVNKIADDGASFRPDADLLVLAVLVAVTSMCVAWVSLDLYNNGVAAEYRTLEERVDAFNALVYDNAYASSPFLNKLLANDPAAALAGVPATAGAETLARAVFTINLWQYFRDRMPDAHPSWEGVKRLFTVDVLMDRRMDVTPFVSASVYASIPNRMFDLEGNLGAAGSQASQDAVADAVTGLMTRANQLLHSLDPAGVQGAFWWYLLTRAGVLALLVGGTLAYFARRPPAAAAFAAWASLSPPAPATFTPPPAPSPAPSAPPAPASPPPAR